MKIIAPLLIVCCFLISCKNSEKRFHEETSIQKATWANWSGGMRGVGGNEYLVQIKVPSEEQVVAENLVIDSKFLEINSQTTTNNLLTITATENKSKVKKTVGDTSNNRPDFRNTDPTSASVDLVSSCCKITLQIPNFEKGKSTRNQ